MAWYDRVERLEPLPCYAACENEALLRPVASISLTVIRLITWFFAHLLFLDRHIFSSIINIALKGTVTRISFLHQAMSLPTVNETGLNWLC